ncbi:COMM domain-containing protein 6 [Protopterus annectens]|uniref:COMM domain-containing protein 6 n=1 Tax=Protopterus annectens TaxID=7888 RepID=UPI001CF9916D|nr:COMM domain-containing protein 6 [Protopterus annectens]
MIYPFLIEANMTQRLQSPGPDIVAKLCSLSDDLLAELCQKVIVLIQNKTEYVNSGIFYGRLQNSGVAFRQSDIEDMIDGMLSIFQFAISKNMDASTLVNELARASTKWTETALQVVKKLWLENFQMSHTKSVPKILHTGKLINLQWKLTMAMSADSYKNVTTPFVTITMHVADPSGQLQLHTIEMTLSELQTFSETFREISASLSMV